MPSTNQIPPYVSHRTFTTFLESLRNGIPDRIDPSVFDASFSGSSKKQITLALKSLNLIDNDGKPHTRLTTLVMGNETDRAGVWDAMLRETYEPVFDELDLETATPYQLRDELRKLARTESMLTKCEAFFKRAAVDAGIKLSPHIRKRKPPSRRKRPESRTPRPDSTRAVVEPAAATDRMRPAPPPAPAPATALIPNGSLAAEVLPQLFLKFDPNWSEEAQENWFNGIERFAKAMNSTTAGPVQDSPSTNGVAD